MDITNCMCKVYLQSLILASRQGYSNLSCWQTSINKRSNTFRKCLRSNIRCWCSITTNWSSASCERRHSSSNNCSLNLLWLSVIGLSIHEALVHHICLLRSHLTISHCHHNTANHATGEQTNVCNYIPKYIHPVVTATTIVNIISTGAVCKFIIYI